MTKMKLGILCIIPLSLVFCGAFFLILDLSHTGDNGLTEYAITKLNSEFEKLETEEEKDAYIRYLTNGIINQRQSNSEYVEDIYKSTRSLVYLLFSIAILQLIVLSSEFKKLFTINRSKPFNDN